MVYELSDRACWSALSDEYSERGIVKIRTGLNTAMLDAVANKLNEWFDNDSFPTTDAASVKPNRVRDAWRYNTDIKHIALQAEVLQLLGFLYNRKPLPFQTLNFQNGTEQPAHSDSIHFNSEPFGLMCGVWLALENVGPKQGPLRYFPGSHKLPEMNFEDMGLKPKKADFREYTAYVKNLIVEKGFEEELGILNKGEAIIWSANVLHGGSKRLSDLSRLSQVTHYYFEDCKYWRPAMSIDERFYFQPNWIKDVPSGVTTPLWKRLLKFGWRR